MQRCNTVLCSVAIPYYAALQYRTMKRCNTILCSVAILCYAALQNCTVECCGHYIMLSGRPIFHPGSHSDYCVVYCNLVQCSSIKYSLVYRLHYTQSRSNTWQYSIRRKFYAVHCIVVQCSAVQCSAVYCRAVQCSAVQCSAA